MMSNDNLDHSSQPKKTDFSIEHILTKAGSNKNNFDSELQNDLIAFSWLNCTRYCPPKLPRSQKKEGPQKRQLGRHPRIPFSSQQLAILEDKFKQSPYLSSAEVTQISRTLQLADIRVKIWFQNRRARERREKNEQEIHQLKPFSKETKNLNNSPIRSTITSSFVSPANIQQTKTYLQHCQSTNFNIYPTVPQSLNYEISDTNNSNLHFLNHRST